MTYNYLKWEGGSPQFVKETTQDTKPRASNMMHMTNLRLCCHNSGAQDVPSSPRSQTKAHLHGSFLIRLCP